MGRSPSCSKIEHRRGAWTAKEDMILCEYVRTHGHVGWKNLPQKAGLKRSGKSCRLRWVNYLRPDIKHGNISPDEEELIIRLHRLLGNRWSLIAGRLPERTDNEIKNYWNTHLSKMLSMKDSQPKTISPKERSNSPPHPKNHVFKPTPVKITSAVRHSPNGCNGFGSNEGFKLSNGKETMDSSRSWCHLLLRDSDKIVETEARNSTSMSILADQRSPYFAAPTANLEESLLPAHCNLLYSPLDCSLIDFGSEEFYRGQFTLVTETNEFESHRSYV